MDQTIAMIPEELSHKIDQDVLVDKSKAYVGFQLSTASPGPGVYFDPQDGWAKPQVRRWQGRVEVASGGIRKYLMCGGRGVGKPVEPQINAVAFQNHNRIAAPD